MKYKNLKIGDLVSVKAFGHRYRLRVDGLPNGDIYSEHWRASNSETIYPHAGRFPSPTDIRRIKEI